MSEALPEAFLPSRHCVLITSGVPNPETSGSAIVNWALLQHMHQFGLRVTCCLLLERSHPHFSLPGASDLDGLRAQGIAVETLFWDSSPAKSGRWRRLLQPTLADLYPLTALQPQVQKLLQRLQPDVIYAYETPCIALALAYPEASCLGVLVDLDHLPSTLRLRTQGLRLHPRAWAIAAATLWQSRQKRHWMLRLLAQTPVVVNFAAHHAAWLQTQGIHQSRYLPPPIPDPLPGWLPEERSPSPQPRPRILMIGHLLGTATQLGLQLTATQVLPRLERELGPQGFEIRIVGGFHEQLPRSLQQRLDHPAVQFLGFLTQVETEFRTCDLLYVPTPVELGTRIRILVGWSYGCCIVAHQANACGIPTLKHGVNALLGQGGATLATALLMAIRQPELRQQLAQAGRKTFETHFQAAIAAPKLIQILMELSL